MIKTKFTFLFFLIPLYSNSQLSGTIYDELKLPVENVSVFCLKNKDTLKTTFSNKNGFFEFKNISESEKDVELIMSHINYETLLTKPVKGKTYILISKQYLIDEVSVISEKKEKKNTVKRALGFIFNDVGNTPFEDELVTFIAPTKENKGKKIKKLKYQLADMRKIGIKNNKYQPFRAGIYTVDTITQLPKEKIYRSEKVRMTKNEKWFYVHIDSLDIRMPEEGLFIFFEALPGEEYKTKYVAAKTGGVYFTTPAIRAKVYNPNNKKKSYRYFHWKKERGQNPWKVNEDYYYSMEFEFEE